VSMAAAAALVEGIVQDAGTWLAELAGLPTAWLVSPGDAAGGVEVGDLEELMLVATDGGGTTSTAVRVLAVDTISQPNRARVEIVATGKVLVVPILEQSQVDGWAAPLATQTEDSQRGAETSRPGELDGGCLDATQTTVYQDFEDAFDMASQKAQAQPPVAQPTVPKSSGTGMLDELTRGIKEEWRATIKDVQHVGAELGASLQLPAPSLGFGTGLGSALEAWSSAGRAMLASPPSTAAPGVG